MAAAGSHDGHVRDRLAKAAGRFAAHLDVPGYGYLPTSPEVIDASEENELGDCASPCRLRRRPGKDDGQSLSGPQPQRCACAPARRVSSTYPSEVAGYQLGQQRRSLVFRLRR
jgi:hypothetical protein